MVREDMKAQNKLVDQLYNTDEELQLGGGGLYYGKKIGRGRSRRRRRGEGNRALLKHLEFW